MLNPNLSSDEVHGIMMRRTTVRGKPAMHLKNLDPTNSDTSSAFVDALSMMGFPDHVLDGVGKLLPSRGRKKALLTSTIVKRCRLMIRFSISGNDDVYCSVCATHEDCITIGVYSGRYFDWHADKMRYCAASVRDALAIVEEQVGKIVAMEFIHQ